MVCEKKVVMNVTAFLHTKVCKRSCQWQVHCIEILYIRFIQQMQRQPVQLHFL